MSSATIIRSFVVMTCVSAASGCGSGQPTPATPPPDPTPNAKLCEQPDGRAVAVIPFGNKTQTKVDIGGADALLSNAMLESGCFTLLERERVNALVQEIALCDGSNPDRSYFDCDSFAQKGKILGAKVMVMGDLVAYEPNVKGADLGAKVPGIGGLDASLEYSALAIEVHVVDVETGKKLGSKVVHASVEATKAGVDTSVLGFKLNAAAHSRTPMGTAIQGMVQDAVRDLRASLGVP